MKKNILLIILLFIYTSNVGAQTLEWAKLLRGAGTEQGYSITVDSYGNVYTTGNFNFTCDFDPGAGTFYITPINSFTNLFISKLDAYGNFVWAKSIGGAQIDYGYSIAVDASGNVYTTGYFTGTADFDPGAGTFNLTSTGGEDLFISKLDANGNFVWAKNFGGGDDFGYSIAVDGNGNVYTTGEFEGTADFDPGAGTFNLTATSGNDIFISKLDASGNFVWAITFGGYAGDHGLSIAVDASGNVYTTGNFSSIVDFDPGAGVFNLVSSVGGSEIFISKLDAYGNFVWAKKLGGTGSETGTSIKVTASGNVYTTGGFEATADFDPGAGVFNLTSVGENDVFISKLDSSGNFVWAKNIGGTTFDAGRSIAVDASENVYTTGYFSVTADFDPGAGTYNLVSSGALDIFISKLDSSGNFVWANKIGGTEQDCGYSIAVDAYGNAYTTGWFAQTADFDPGVGTYNLAAEGTDIFIQKLKQKGVVGYVYNDINQNCTRDIFETPMQNRLITINPGNIIAQTNDAGIWTTDPLPVGTYTATVDSSGKWAPTCPVFQTFNVISPNEITSVPDFGLVSTQPCASPEVSIFMPFMRPCFHNQFVYVNVSNQNIATGAINNAYVDVDLGAFVTPVSATLPFTTLGANVYRFLLGTLNPGQTVNISINCTESCSAVLGQTQCIQANLYPVDTCVLDTVEYPYPGEFTPCELPWDRSNVQVEGYCQNDSVYFVIHNTGLFGSGDMDCFAPMRFYIDGVYIMLDSLRLVGGDSLVISFAGDGRTWRLEVDQHPDHPGDSHPNVTVEACGDINNWTPGNVTILPQDDADPIVDIYCGMVTGSFDPNDKTGYPTGITTEHHIMPNQQMQYVVRFQNTGTDTAFTVVVRDTLDENLDIFSVVPGIASHNYNFHIYGPRVLEWTFYNILLPDSNANQSGSNGFLTYTVNQKENLPDATEIKNSADIYFDYNVPVITNQTLHTIYKPMLTYNITDTINTQESFCDQYTINGFTYSQSGTYYQTNPGILETDTLLILELTNQSNYFIITDTACGSYTLNGMTYNTSGVFFQPYVNSFGCDSIFELRLTMVLNFQNEVNVSVCEGEKYILPDGNIAEITGVYITTLSSINGCDSVITTNLTVIPLPDTPVITQLNDSLFSNVATGNQWYFNNSIISGAVNNYYVPTATGYYSVLVAESNCYSDTSDAVYFLLTGIVPSANFPCSVYPNPARNELIISTSGLSVDQYFEIVNMVGQTMIKSNLETKTIIDISSLPRGIYFVKLFTENAVHTTKFVKE